MKYVFWVLLLASQLCLAQDNSAETPISPTLIDLTLAVSDVVAINDSQAGASLRDQAVELTSLVDQRACATQIGIQSQESEDVKVELAAYEIPGAPCNDQMLSLIEQFEQFSSLRDKIYPFRNLLGEFARSKGLNSLENFSSTDLATQLSQFAATQYHLYLPKG